MGCALFGPWMQELSKSHLRVKLSRTKMAVNLNQRRLLPIAVGSVPHSEQFVVDVAAAHFLKARGNEAVGGTITQNVLHDAAEEAELTEALFPDFVVHRAIILAG